MEISYWMYPGPLHSNSVGFAADGGPNLRWILIKLMVWVGMRIDRERAW